MSARSLKPQASSAVFELQLLVFKIFLNSLIDSVRNSLKSGVAGLMLWAPE